MLSSADRLAIGQLYADYNRTIDTGDNDGWVATWTEGGAFEHPTRTYRGHEQLAGFVATRTAGLGAHPVSNQRHWNAETVIQDGDESGGISGHCLLLVAGADRASGRPVILASGRYCDEFAATPLGWRFARRVLTLD